MTNNDMTRDLDMSDVHADADRAFQAHLDAWNHLSTADLLHQRYYSGIAARVYGSRGGAIEVQVINNLILVRESNWEHIECRHSAGGWCLMDCGGCGTCGQCRGNDEDQYWSGTGELMNDDSYIRYLNS